MTDNKDEKGKKIVIPTKFHKSLGNVKDEDITDGEIRLLQALIRSSEEDIISYRLKEERAKEKIEKIWNDLREFKQLAQESRIFIDEHKLFVAMCLASGITPKKGRSLFYKRVEKKIKRRLEKRQKRNNDKKKKIQKKQKA